MSRLFNTETQKPKAAAKRKVAAKKSHKPTQAELDATIRENWGLEAFKTVQRFRRIWEKEGVKLVP